MDGVIAFGRIRADFPSGQRGAFEELVAQLARRQAPNPASFRRLEGAGGDGGVECLHGNPDGGIVGYQAKYHTRPSDIDWRAIDRSVQTALALHTDLVTYVIAIACDFTGRRRVKGGAVSEGTWGEWDERVERWQADAAAMGRSVTFVPWTADALRGSLTPLDAAGLRRYWFNALEFSADWFRDRVHLAAVALDERYHPDDHVEVTSQGLFEVITRHPRLRDRLTAQFRKVGAHGLPSQQLPAADPQAPQDLLFDADRSVQELLQHEQDVTFPNWQPWASEQWRHLAAAAISTVSKLSQWSWEVGAEARERRHDYFRHKLQQLSGDLHEFQDFLSGRFFSAEARRSAFITGRAGSGKSHLLARVAEVAALEGTPVVLLLGQQLREGPLWPQILERLGLVGVGVDEFLGALDTAAECGTTRALILVDAINEGAGVQLWRNEIATFLAQLNTFRNLACVLSCRSEYVDYLVPSGVLQGLTQIEIRGFETRDEQANAARVYLDRRGISRPATPWLAPEFVNPLFLRSCCVALSRDGKTEFPRGLTGTKTILAFFVESVARHLGAGRDGSDDLIGSTKASLLEIAAQMATSRKNYLARGTATEIAQRPFGSFVPPAGLTWLDVLHRNGLVRFDPDPDADAADPLRRPLDVVRFGFQRFQDHLIAESLLAGIADATIALAPGGALAFVHNGERINWEWRGTVEALSSQLPERLKIEFVDALPGGATQWWTQGHVQDAFVESVRWRDEIAFSDRTLELFNWLSSTNHEPISLLIELSASVGHPWNAELIHRNLLKRPLAERDAFWTVDLNAATGDESHPIHRLIDWCTRPEAQRATPETLRLCGLTLSWCLTASSRPVRDQASKALTAMMSHHPELFEELLSGFKGVDDLYVWERLFAAAFGACCTTRSVEQVRKYAELTAEALFADRTPPMNLLLRDYALGIIELAEHMGVLPETVNKTLASPPYSSPFPDLAVTEAEIEKVASVAGDNTILHSCLSFGDFGRYTIEHKVDDFTTIKLARPIPLTSRERFEKFEREVVDLEARRVAALKRIRDLRSANIQIVVMGKRLGKRLSESALRKLTADTVKAEKKFVTLLGVRERHRYESEARQHLGLAAKNRRRDPKHVDVENAKRWVAKRAYELGWTKTKFWREVESHYFRSESGRPQVERIGKKYQWLAFSELLCRLADNFWMGGGLDGKTRKYDYSTDIGFLRDIEPTVLPASARKDDDAPSWTSGPLILIPTTPEERLLEWPFMSDPGSILPSLIARTDPEEQTWMTLYEHRGVTARYEGPRLGLHGLRQQEFRFVYCVLVSTDQIKTLLEHLKKKRNIDVHSWDPPEFTDGPYLLEAPWRRTWPQDQLRADAWGTPQGVRISFPIFEYMWESHLDASLPNGARAFLPAPWLAHEMGLSPSRSDPASHIDVSGSVRFISAQSRADGSCALIEAAPFQKFLERRSLQCVWMFVAERNAWPGGNNSNASWRRSEGFCWIDGSERRSVTWLEDHKKSRAEPDKRG